MKKLNIKELEITKEMYNRAKEIEDINKELHGLNCRTEKFKELNNKVIELEDKFEEEISDEFLTLEIVNEYERREKQEKIKKLTREETIILMMKKANEIYKNGWSWDSEMEIWRICSDWNSNHDEDEEIGMYEHSDENNIVDGFCIEDDSWVF